MRAALLALLICACAAAPPPPSEIDAAQAIALITRVLSDACTSRATDEFLVGHTVFLLRACHGTIPQCLRKVCVRLSEEDRQEPDGGTR